MNERLYRQPVELDARGRLLVPELKGVTLSKLLGSKEYSSSIKYRAVAAATQALRELHQVSVRGATLVPRGFSHGDATAD